MPTSLLVPIWAMVDVSPSNGSPNIPNLDQFGARNPFEHALTSSTTICLAKQQKKWTWTIQWKNTEKQTTEKLLIIEKYGTMSSHFWVLAFGYLWFTSGFWRFSPPRHIDVGQGCDVQLSSPGVDELHHGTHHLENIVELDQRISEHHKDPEDVIVI